MKSTQKNTSCVNLPPLKAGKNIKKFPKLFSTYERDAKKEQLRGNSI